LTATMRALPPPQTEEALGAALKERALMRRTVRGRKVQICLAACNSQVWTHRSLHLGTCLMLLLLLLMMMMLPARILQSVLMVFQRRQTKLSVLLLMMMMLMIMMMAAAVLVQVVVAVSAVWAAVKVGVPRHRRVEEELIGCVPLLVGRK